MKFGMQIEVDHWYTTVCCMIRSKVKVMGASDVPKIALFKVYLLHHLQWELANDNWFLN